MMFQGVTVPPGQHTVVFELVSSTLRIGITISIWQWLCVLFMLRRERSAR